MHVSNRRLHRWQAERAACCHGCPHGRLASVWTLRLFRGLPIGRGGRRLAWAIWRARSGAVLCMAADRPGGLPIYRATVRPCPKRRFPEAGLVRRRWTWEGVPWPERARLAVLLGRWPDLPGCGCVHALKRPLRRADRWLGKNGWAEVDRVSAQCILGV